MGFSRPEHWSGLPCHSSRGSSWSRDQTQASGVSCIASRFFTHSVTWEALSFLYLIWYWCLCYKVMVMNELTHITCLQQSLAQAQKNLVVLLRVCIGVSHLYYYHILYIIHYWCISSIALYQWRIWSNSDPVCLANASSVDKAQGLCLTYNYQSTELSFHLTFPGLKFLSWSTQYVPWKNSHYFTVALILFTYQLLWFCHLLSTPHQHRPHAWPGVPAPSVCQCLAPGINQNYLGLKRNIETAPLFFF